MDVLELLQAIKANPELEKQVSNLVSGQQSAKPSAISNILNQLAQTDQGKQELQSFYKNFSASSQNQTQTQPQATGKKTGLKQLLSEYKSQQKTGDQPKTGEPKKTGMGELLTKAREEVAKQGTQQTQTTQQQNASQQTNIADLAKKTLANQGIPESNADMITQLIALGSQKDLTPDQIAKELEGIGSKYPATKISNTYPSITGSTASTGGQKTYEDLPLTQRGPEFKNFLKDKDSA